ncbi:MAG: ABC transporter permease [Syntrophaceae bacterium]|nr:ABC transporter permease [Syntrophaceae bacterium]
MTSRKLKELIRKEILILLRDRQTIPVLFIMPVALIFFLSLAMQGIYTEKITGQRITVVIETAGGSPKAALLAGKINAHKLIQRVERPQGYDNNKLFEYGRAHAVIFIPDEFENGTKPVEMEFDPVLDAGYKAAVRSLMTSLTASVVMGIDDMEAMAASFIVEKTKKNKSLPGPLQQSVPGWSIFAMFFIAIPMSIGFLREKNDGTLQRLFTYPVGANLIIFGKLIPYYLINLIQFALMLLVGIWIMPLFIKFPFTLGSHPWHLIPVTLVVAAASTGFGVMIAALGRSPEQSSALAATGAVMMAVFGGIMVPHVVMPIFMKKLAMISPMFWAHQAYLDVFVRDADFSSILPKLAVLTFFALVCFYIAGRKVKWM